MVPHRIGSDWEVSAPAKLNLYLEVLGRRTDGFHDLESLLVPVRLCDQLRWSPKSCDTCQLSDGFSFSMRAVRPVGDELADCEPVKNLAVRAVCLLAERVGIQPWGHLLLVKRIPSQAGLGGGSSDAASALQLANAAWNAGLPHEELALLAAELGSDVPFFMQQGPAVCRGRGERVEPISGLPSLHFVLVKPASGLSTAQVFGELEMPKLSALERQSSSADRLAMLLKSLRSLDLCDIARWMTNRLQGVSERLLPEIAHLKATLRHAGCWASIMTGSGSAVAGLVRTSWQAARIARVLSAQNKGIVLTTCSGW